MPYINIFDKNIYYEIYGEGNKMHYYISMADRVRAVWILLTRLKC